MAPGIKPECLLHMRDRDAEAVQAVLAGNKAAYADLYDRYARLVLSVCLNATGRIAPAQDLSQEVFLRAYCRLADLRRPELFGRWLLGITRLVCKEWKRAKIRDRHQFCGSGPMDVAEATAEDDDFEQVHEAIMTLPEKERLAIQAFYLQGHSVERGQAILGLSRSGFYNVLDRARQRLARLMKQTLKGDS